MSENIKKWFNYVGWCKWVRKINAKYVLLNLDYIFIYKYLLL